jgi:hypothetical protein
VPSVVDVGEAFAEGRASHYELREARRRLSDRGGIFSRMPLMSAGLAVPDEDARHALDRVVKAPEGFFKLVEDESNLGAAGIWSVREPAPKGAALLAGFV